MINRGWIARLQGANLRTSGFASGLEWCVEQLWKGMGQTIPLACQDWANTKAAYRFMDNDRVSEHDILSGHFRATAQRFSMTDGPILVLQDTTTFSYERERPELVGYAGTAITSAERRGQAKPGSQMRHPGCISSLCRHGTGRSAARTDSHQVLEPQGVQRHRDDAEQSQFHTHTDREKGKLSLD